MRDIVQHGTAALEPFKGSTAGHPDPSWVLQLSDETLTYFATRAGIPSSSVAAVVGHQ